MLFVAGEAKIMAGSAVRSCCDLCLQCDPSMPGSSSGDPTRPPVNGPSACVKVNHQ